MLNELLKQKNMDGAQLARLIGWDRSQWSRLASGEKYRKTRETLKNIPFYRHHSESDISRSV
ncbi:MAG: helix-turn-helix transcriptional regulator [Rickettsiales bacterium]